MKSILFKPDMIKAIIEGRKTQTRRVIKPQPFIRDGVMRWTPKMGIDINLTDHSDLAIPFARYKVGETVYIKETWRIGECSYPHKVNLYPSSGFAIIEYRTGGKKLVAWNAWLEKNTQYGGSSIGDGEKWHSPMFMPAWAARTFIKITDVKVERLQNWCWRIYFVKIDKLRGRCLLVVSR